MEFQEFIDRYLLTFEIKRAKKQNEQASPHHVVHSVKIKSLILPGKFKLKYQFNPTFVEDAKLESILQCVQSDCMSCHPDYVEKLSDFLIEYGYNDSVDGIVEGTRIWGECNKQLEKVTKFLGEGGLQDLFECVE
jgi:hypothetical protein